MFMALSMPASLASPVMARPPKSSRNACRRSVSSGYPRAGSWPSNQPTPEAKHCGSGSPSSMCEYVSSLRSGAVMSSIRSCRRVYRSMRSRYLPMKMNALSVGSTVEFSTPPQNASMSSAMSRCL